MKAGFVGLGKMGFNMASHLLECGHDLVVFDLMEEAVLLWRQKERLLRLLCRNLPVCSILRV